MNRLRWKRKPKSAGRTGLSLWPRGSELHDGITRYAYTTSSDTRGTKWYWIARADEAGVWLKNTHLEPVKTEAEAKAQALAYVRGCLGMAALNKEAANG